MTTENTLTRQDFVSDQDVRWCPGCGDYAILAQMQKIMPELGIPRENIVFVSGIGFVSFTTPWSSCWSTRIHHSSLRLWWLESSSSFYSRRIRSNLSCIHAAWFCESHSRGSVRWNPRRWTQPLLWATRGLEPCAARISRSHQLRCCPSVTRGFQCIVTGYLHRSRDG